MESFDQELRQEMFEAVGYRCGIDPRQQATDAHHVKANSKINRKRWPLYIQSPMNLMPVNNGDHTTHPLPEPPSDRVLDVIEKWLTKLEEGV